MIVSTENALLARLNDVFGNTLRDIATHPGDWSEAGLRDVLPTPPSVYLVWLLAQAGQVKGVIDSCFIFYVVAEVINGAEGDRSGLYQIVVRLIAGLSGFHPSHAGPMRFEEGRNLYTEQQEQHGVVLYGTYFICEEPVTVLMQDNGVDEYLRHYQTFTQNDGSPPFVAPITLRGGMTMNDTDNTAMRFPNPFDLPMILWCRPRSARCANRISYRCYRIRGPGCRVMLSGCVSRMYWTSRRQQNRRPPAKSHHLPP